MPHALHNTLGDARFLALTTFRRDGRAVTTPVWPVAVEGRLLVGTPAGTAKVKRLRANPRVRFAPCNGNGSQILGGWREGQARVLPADPALEAAYLAAARRKYGLQFHLIKLLYRLRGLWADRVLIEIAEAPPA